MNISPIERALTRTENGTVQTPHEPFKVRWHCILSFTLVLAWHTFRHGLLQKNKMSYTEEDDRYTQTFIHYI